MVSGIRFERDRVSLHIHDTDIRLANIHTVNTKIDQLQCLWECLATWTSEPVPTT
jgi:hypothetical protein